MRSFDPVYDAQSFDLSFPFGSRPYLVPAGRAHPLAVRAACRAAGRCPPRTPRRERRGRRTDRGTWTPTACRTAWSAVPVVEARYSGLQAVKGGLAWLRAPGHAACSARAAPTWTTTGRARPWSASTCASERSPNWPTSSTGSPSAATAPGWSSTTRDELRVMPSDGKRDDTARDRHGRTCPGPGSPADPAALWRHAYAEAGRLMRRDFWVPDMSGVDWDGVLASYRPLLDRIRGSADFADLLWEVVGELGTSHAYVAAAERRRPAAAPSPAGRPAGRGPVPRPGRALAGGPGAARRVVRPAGPLAAGRARGGGAAGRRAGGGGRAAGRPGARPVAAAGRHRRPAGRADRAARRAAEPRRVVVVPLRERAAAALPGLGGRAAPPGPRAQRGPPRLPAHPGHDGGGLGALPPRPADRDGPRRADLRRARRTAAGTPPSWWWRSWPAA